MSARPKPVRDFDPQSQRMADTVPSVSRAGTNTQAGGSLATPQAAAMKRGPAGGQSSAPKSPQRLRG